MEKLSVQGQLRYTLQGGTETPYEQKQYRNAPQGSTRKLSNNSTKWSISKAQLQGGPLTKQDILETYSDIFTRIGKFPGDPYKFKLKPNAKPTRHAPRKVPIHLQELSMRKSEFVKTWNIGRNKRSDRVGKQLCHC